MTIPYLLIDIKTGELISYWYDYNEALQGVNNFLSLSPYKKNDVSLFAMDDINDTSKLTLSTTGKIINIS